MLNKHIPYFFHQARRVPPALRLGSDCTGYNSAAFALEGLSIPYVDVFASDSDPHVRSVLEMNFPGLKDGGNIYPDCTQRGVAAKVALYTAGFPCQPYSKIGVGKGEGDPRAKNIVKSIIGYVRDKQPVCFVLENVAGLVDSHRPFFDWILNQLRKITNKNREAVYEVMWSFVNTQDHGIAQGRKRVLIVGLTLGAKVHEFQWPAAVLMRDLDTFLEPFNRAQAKSPDLPKSVSGLSNYLALILKIQEKGGKAGKREEPWVGDLAASVAYGPNLTYNRSPCITRARAGSGGYYLFSRGRMTTQRELFRLQGVPDGRIRRPAGVTHRQITMMIGNAFSVNVFARVFLRLLKCADLIDQSLPDPW